jgi:hypothetical protein
MACSQAPPPIPAQRPLLPAGLVYACHMPPSVVYMRLASAVLGVVVTAPEGLDMLERLRSCACVHVATKASHV